MKVYNYLLFIMFSILYLNACGGESTSQENLQNQEEIISFDLGSTEGFNPYINHGQIEVIQMVISGLDFSEPIIKRFPYGTTKGTLPPIEIGKQIQVEVQGLNSNGVVVRRGISDIFTVDKNYPQKVNLEYYDVPIFTNIYDGAKVYQSRFIPKVFAKSNLSFQLADHFSGDISPLFDLISGEDILNFSQADDLEFNQTVPISPLKEGDHVIQVTDPFSNESTEVNIQIIKDHSKQYLVTSSGQFMGSWGIQYNLNQAIKRESHGE